MNPTLPPLLKAAIDALLEGVPRKALAERTGATPRRYRGGEGSSVAIASRDDALAYVVARLPATYAVASAAFAEVARAAPQFHPASLLDVGAGPGTASWAALETWPDVTEIALSDSNPRFLALARMLWRDRDPLAQFIAHDLGHAEELPRAELVVASYVLAEIAAGAQQPTVEKLYAAARDVLVLIEPGTPAGFERIRAARAQLIGQGARVLAPCTHTNACPMAGADWCHFSQRLPRSRDHMKAKGASVPYEDERYSWLAVSRTRVSAFEGSARILAPPKDTKAGIELKLCTPEGLENRFVAKRDKEQFSTLRKVNWGDIL